MINIYSAMYHIYIQHISTYISTLTARKVWTFVNDVLQVGDVISHDNVIFGVDLDSSMNYVVSIIVYYIYTAC